MKSMASPQQCSLVPGQAQSRVQKISRTLPGNPLTVFCAPFTAAALHAPTAGIRGAGKPPDGEVPGRQHLNSVGPGHNPARVLPEAHVSEKRQFPPLPHEALVQHRISAGRPSRIQVSMFSQSMPPSETSKGCKVSYRGTRIGYGCLHLRCSRPLKYRRQEHRLLLCRGHWQ